MNLKDCIHIIKNCTMLACEYHIKDKCDYGYEVKENRFECAKEQAIKALEEIEEYRMKEFQYHLAYEEGIGIGYNKAVEDFAERISNKIKQEIDDCADELEWVDEIAEQLKG